MAGKIINPSALDFCYTNHRKKAKLKVEDFGECAVNAIVTLTGLPYNEVRKDLAEVNAAWTYRLRKHPMLGSNGKTVKQYWKGKRTFRCGTRVIAREFIDYMKDLGYEKVIDIRKHRIFDPVLSISQVHKKYGDCLVSIDTPPDGKHGIAIKDGILHDYIDTRIVHWMGEWESRKKVKEYLIKQGVYVGDKSKKLSFVTGLAEPYANVVFAKVK